MISNIIVFDIKTKSNELLKNVASKEIVKGGNGISLALLHLISLGSSQWMKLRL